MNQKKLRSQQKHTIGIVHNKTKLDHTKELFKSTNVLNLYELNILSIAVLIHKVHKILCSPVFTGRFQRISYLYSRRSSTLNFSKPKLKATKTKYRIAIRGLAIWNDYVENCFESIEKAPLFKVKLKSKLLNLIMR